MSEPKPPCAHLSLYMRFCSLHGRDPWSCPDILFCRNADGSYGIPVRDGGRSWVAISHCPFCGEKLTGGTNPTRRIREIPER